MRAKVQPRAALCFRGEGKSAMNRRLLTTVMVWIVCEVGLCFGQGLRHCPACEFDYTSEFVPPVYSGRWKPGATIECGSLGTEPFTGAMQKVRDALSVWAQGRGGVT
jgi:hypothetical protein